MPCPLGRELPDPVPPVIGGHRLDPFRAMVRQIPGAQKSPQSFEIGLDPPGDFSLVEGVPARPANPFQRRRQMGIGEDLPRAGGPLLQSKGLQEAGPLPVDRHALLPVPGNDFRDRKPLPGIFNRGSEQFLHRQLPEAVVEGRTSRPHIPARKRRAGPGRAAGSDLAASVLPAPREYGERPLPLSPDRVFAPASHTKAKRSPPTPQETGSTNPSTALAAIAASTAVPPFLRISRATWVARGWLVAAIPLRASTSERVAHLLPATATCRPPKRETPVPVPESIVTSALDRNASEPWPLPDIVLGQRPLVEPFQNVDHSDLLEADRR